MVSYFGFPRSKDLHKKWIVAIKRDEGKHFKVTQSTKVCSKHFKEEQYLPGYVNGRRFLKEGVVPSVFRFSVTKVPRRTLHRNATAPPSSPVNVAAAVGDEAGTPSCEDQLPPDPNASLLPQEEVAEQAALVRRLTSDLEKSQEELSKAQREVLKLKRHIELLEEENKKLKQKSQNGENVKLWSVSYSQDSKQGRPRSLPPHDELFLILVRLRLGLFEKDLAFRFGISVGTVSRLCTTWISYLYMHFARLDLWATRQQVDEDMPPAFKEKYPTTRVILDATEIKCQVPSSLVLQSASFSAYKSTNTFKGLVGISPDGAVTFVSQLFLGSMSDKECVRQSGFLQLAFDQRDSVMADKGFLISDLLTEINVELNIPPFLGQGTFTENEVKETENIASLRIHVKRRIQRIKSFHIFDRAIPLSLGPVVNEIWTICTILTNFQGPLLRQQDSGNVD
ncbi:uncharacterized protein ISCGN_024696 [Ixodes scapularis]